MLILKQGQTTTAAWDNTLLDDGLSEDGAEGDFVFARKIILADGVNLKSSQVVFFQVTKADDSIISFAYTFPALVSGAIVGS